MGITTDTIKSAVQIDRAFKKAIEEGVNETAVLVEGEAARRAPKDTSALRQSADTEKTSQFFNSIKAEVFFDLPYARRQHEENYNHDDGERHYLKNATEMHGLTLISKVKARIAGMRI